MRRLLRSAPRGTGVTILASGGAAASTSFRVHDAPPPSETQLARAEYRAWRLGSPSLADRLLTRPLPAIDPDILPTDHSGRRVGAVAEHLRTASRPAASRLESDFQLADTALLGRGGFGVVVRAASLTDGRNYAVKVVELRPDGGDEMQEVRCMAALPPHPNLVRYYSSWLEDGEACAWLASLEPDADESESEESTWGAGSEAEGERQQQAADEASAHSVATAHADEAEHAQVDFPVGLRALWQQHWPEDLTDASSASPPAAGDAGAGVPLLRRQLVIQMEYCAAPTLQAVLRAEAEGGAPPAAEHVRWRWLQGLAEALTVLHAHGWAHLDVKPANVFCAADGALKLADFGMAHAVESFAAAPGVAYAPPAPHCGGTRLYAAPEVTHGLGGCPASDMYSMGVVAAEVHGGFTTAMERSIVVGGLAAATAGGRRRTAVQSGGRAAADPRLPNEHATTLVRRLLQPELTARPTALEVRDDVAREATAALERLGLGAAAAHVGAHGRGGLISCDAELESRDAEIEMLRALLLASQAAEHASQSAGGAAVC